MINYQIDLIKPVKYFINYIYQTKKTNRYRLYCYTLIKINQI